MSHCTVFNCYITGCIDVSIAQTVYSDLLQSLDCLVLSTDLHLLYIVIPFNMIDSIQPNWTIYFEIVREIITVFYHPIHASTIN